jgi:hypothetical protein
MAISNPSYENIKEMGSIPKQGSQLPPSIRWLGDKRARIWSFPWGTIKPRDETANPIAIFNKKDTVLVTVSFFLIDQCLDCRLDSQLPIRIILSHTSGSEVINY